MNAAKHAQKLKHIRKIKGAIRFREAEKKRLAPIIKENRESKQYILQRLRHEHESIKTDIITARNNAKEDWHLGPLRPNRAIGEDAERYGVMDRKQLRDPQIPKHWFGAKESVQKRMKFKIPENVLRDQWPIVKGDRVVVIRGRELNKIGEVEEVIKESNQIILKDMNKIYADGRVFNSAPGQEPEVKREFSHAMPYDDVRLLIPWDVEYETKNGTIIKERQDVIVDAIELEKHTTGRNPFTGEVNQPFIPEEHQVDPTTEQVIWHRYIAGTRQPIEWPWEESQQKEIDEKRRKRKDEGDDAVEADAGKSVKGSQGDSFLRTANPLNWLRKNNSSGQDAQVSKESEGKHLAPEYAVENQHRARPREFEPPAYDDDTGRNIIEIDENHPDHFVPTLVYPPMPETVAEELRDTHISHINRKRAESELSAEELKAERATRKVEKQAAKQRRLDSMKTPMQIRWDLEQAKKIKYDPNNPTPPSTDLLLALGKHMAENHQITAKRPGGTKEAEFAA